MEEKRKWGKKTIAIIIIAVLGLLLMAQQVYAYFYQILTVNGTRNIVINNGEITVTSTEDNGQVNLTIQNTGNMESSIRLKVFAVTSKNYEIEDWTKEEDGYYYYQEPIQPKETINNIVLPISISDTNMITVVESLPTTYQENGIPNVNWDKKIGGEY